MFFKKKTKPLDNPRLETIMTPYGRMTRWKEGFKLSEDEWI